MNTTRRDWLKLTGSASLVATLGRQLAGAAGIEFPRDVQPLTRDDVKPMFNLPAQFSTPIIIESIEMLKRGSTFFVRTRAKDGAVGLTGTKQVEDFLPIFQNLVAPQFIGKDARDIESL